MSIELIIGLIGLALIDSTSIGTLLIPVWLLLNHQQVQASRLVVYLLTIAGFYVFVGLAIMLGADFLVQVEGLSNRNEEASTGSLTQLTISVIQLLIGIWLFAISFRLDSSKPGAVERIERWQQRAANATTSVRFLMGLALLAAIAEVATMLPYLGAIALIASENLSWPIATALMLAYCLVMILPALVLLAMRLALGKQLEPILMKINAWVAENAETTLGWVLGIAGFWIAIDAIGSLI